MHAAQGQDAGSSSCKTCLRLLGEEVLPAMREMAKELDLPGPFEVLPGSRPLPASGKREAVIPENVAA